MRELLRTNDPVALSLAMALLKDAGIECVMFDNHASILEGSISAIQKRMMVLDEDYGEARELLVCAELLDSVDSADSADSADSVESRESREFRNTPRGQPG